MNESPTLDPSDWRLCAEQFRELFGLRRTNRYFTLAGPNFMTPDLLGFVDVDDEPVEITTGVFLGERLYGVTFGPGPNCLRSMMCESLDEVYEYLYGQEQT